MAVLCLKNFPEQVSAKEWFTTALKLLKLIVALLNRG